MWPDRPRRGYAAAVTELPWGTPTEERRALADGGTLTYRRRWLPGTEADALFAAMEREIEWRQRSIRMGARVLLEPRLTAWHGEAGAVYTYSGLRNEPRPFTDALGAMRARLEEELSTRFDSVLLNLYRHGQDSMGFHSDAEPELGRDPLIASVSLGAARRFVLRHRQRKDEPKVELLLEHGSLLVMGGALQHHWQHAIPKTRRPVGARINLTFRWVRGR